MENTQDHKTTLILQNLYAPGAIQNDASPSVFIVKLVKIDEHACVGGCYCLPWSKVRLLGPVGITT